MFDGLQLFSATVAGYLAGLWISSMLHHDFKPWWAHLVYATLLAANVVCVIRPF